MVLRSGYNIHDVDDMCERSPQSVQVSGVSQIAGLVDEAPEDEPDTVVQGDKV